MPGILKDDDTKPEPTDGEREEEGEGGAVEREPVSNGDAGRSVEDGGRGRQGSCGSCSSPEAGNITVWEGCSCV